MVPKPPDSANTTPRPLAINRVLPSPLRGTLTTLAYGSVHAPVVIATSAPQVGTALARGVIEAASGAHGPPAQAAFFTPKALIKDYKGLPSSMKATQEAAFVTDAPTQPYA